MYGCEKRPDALNIVFCNRTAHNPSAMALKPIPEADHITVRSAVAKCRSRTYLILFTVSLLQTAAASEFPPPVSRSDIPRLMNATAFVRGLSEEALIALVPEQSGLRFIDCPNCTAGHQENQLIWKPESPDSVACRYCGHQYPSEVYPATESVTVLSPQGKTAKFPYWADSKGYRHFFAARRDDLVRDYLAERTRELALLYAVTEDPIYARRAAILLDRFAQVFPGWCYHFDYPFQQKQIYDGHVSPAQFRPGYRTARWNWWAYSDIPVPLVEAYDWIRDSGVFAALTTERGIDTAMRIEQDLIRNAAEQVLANPEPYTNMSPTAWRALVLSGRVLNEPRYVHEVVRRLRTFVDTQFFYDGAWPEGSPDYAAQTVGGLERVLSLLRGYSDPEDYSDAVDGGRFDQLDPAVSLPAMKQAREAQMKMRLPDGRSVPVHDTWSTSRRGSLKSTSPWLLPALGHACLGGGTDRHQTQLHLTWSGGYGHSHADNLSILLFAHQRELLSDLGYSHTAYRSWTLATAAHNTVVIDGRNQALGSRQAPTDGRLLFCDLRNPRVQVVSADGTRGYPGLASIYRRTMVLVAADEGSYYAVDLFEVNGGRTHDYFLHGDADHVGTVTTELPLTQLSTLLPSGFNWAPTQNEGEAHRTSETHYAYGFLRNLRSADATAEAVLPVTFHSDAADSGPGVRVFLFPQADSQLITGDNPSVRLAREDDANLERFHRPFLMLRHRPDDGRSRFLSVLEPFEIRPSLNSVERISVSGDAVVLRVQTGDRTDLIVVGADERVMIPSNDSQAIAFKGLLGVLSLRHGDVEQAYALGEGGWSCGDYQLISSAPQSTTLIGVDADTLIVPGRNHTPPGPGDILRLITADGWVYPYSIADVQTRDETWQLRVNEGPGFVYDTALQQLKLTSFPQREHRGSVQIEWISSATQSLERN